MTFGIGFTFTENAENKKGALCVDVRNAECAEKIVNIKNIQEYSRVRVFLNNKPDKEIKFIKRNSNNMSMFLKRKNKKEYSKEYSL